MHSACFVALSSGIKKLLHTMKIDFKGQQPCSEDRQKGKRKGGTGGGKRQRFMHGQSYRPDEPEESVMSRDILFHVHQHH